MISLLDDDCDVAGYKTIPSSKEPVVNFPLKKLDPYPEGIPYQSDLYSAQEQNKRIN